MAVSSNGEGSDESGRQISGGATAGMSNVSPRPTARR